MCYVPTPVFFKLSPCSHMAHVFLQVLELVPLELGFDVEVKYPVPEVGNHDYDFPFLDRGLMADAILGVILPHCGRRNMFLSCFDADMCTM